MACQIIQGDCTVFDYIMEYGRYHFFLAVHLHHEMQRVQDIWPSRFGFNAFVRLKRHGYGFL